MIAGNLSSSGLSRTSEEQRLHLLSGTNLVETFSRVLSNPNVLLTSAHRVLHIEAVHLEHLQKPGLTALTLPPAVSQRCRAHQTILCNFIMRTNRHRHHFRDISSWFQALSMLPLTV